MMKLCVFFILIFIAHLSYAKVVLNNVNVACSNSELCSNRIQRYQNLIGNYRSLVHLKETLRIIAADGGYESFTYDIYQKDDDQHTLDIAIKIKPIIAEVNVGTLDRNLDGDPATILNVREGEFFEVQKLNEALEHMQNRLEAMGYPHNFYEAKTTVVNNKIRLNVGITLGKPRVFKSIKTNTTSPYIAEFLKRKFYPLYNAPFEITKFKLYLDEAQRELFSYGYYLINLDFSSTVQNEKVILDIKVNHDQFFAFDFKNLEVSSRDAMLSLVQDLFRKYKRVISVANLKRAIEEFYDSKGHLNTQVGVKTSQYKNRYNEKVTLYRVTVEENRKTKLTDIKFNGNTIFSSEELNKMFYKEAFELAAHKYYDKEYFNFFVGFLRGKYIERGFVQAKVVGPNVTFDSDKSKAAIEYLIQEGPRAFVKKISLTGVPAEFEEVVTQKMFNKTGKAFNPIAMMEDLKLVTEVLQERGFYFAEVANINEDNIVSYSKNATEVEISIIVNSGPLVRLNRVIYLGNNKTSKKVLSKKVSLKEGELLTPAKTREIEASISATGLFNTVSVSPLKHTSKSASTDLIIKVSERDYGLVELAPGYRTDIGIKLSGAVSYMNIGGMNRAVTLKSQVNQRLNFQTFDKRRRKERKQLLEHNTALTYTQGDIKDTLIDSASSISYQRKRFFSFDADIFRLSQTFTRDLSQRLSSSVRYQYEDIKQFDATEERDNGSFRIGAITPSLTYDLRNSQILPTKGAFFNLSCEFANPFFLSQDNQDPTVNYYKLISRNRFYVPFKNGTVAISLVGGVQENLATGIVKDSSGQPVVVDGRSQTEGYIPNIKVFRLTGMDIVRGFNDEEINRLSVNQDISEVRVQNTAFLANFKLEPRYFINDNLMAGIFLDAGRVYVDQVDLDELRTSAGLTFKIVTPVGTLDFDYGLKLLRKRNQDGTLEDPGRFHVSIGFF